MISLVTGEPFINNSVLTVALLSPQTFSSSAALLEALSLSESIVGSIASPPPSKVPVFSSGVSKKGILNARNQPILDG